MFREFETLRLSERREKRWRVSVVGACRRSPVFRYLERFHDAEESMRELTEHSYLLPIMKGLRKVNADLGLRAEP